ncbi:MAG: phage terminase large subunit [Pigmentiphaga sp.]
MLNPWIPHEPTTKQAEFLLLPHIEALYGGAAGGGKSNALLMAALQYVDVPGYSAILFRRTYSDLALPGALMDRAHEWLDGTAAEWRDKDKTWRFPSGATLSFGYLENENDKFRYQSAEFQFIGFDELTQFAESQYRYLFSRLRRLRGAGVPLRMRAASNPGGVGHEWVRARFLPDEGGHPERPFIPAFLEDNPYLDREEYELSLAQLDPVTRAQLRNGDWRARRTGGMFKREWFEGGIIERPPPGIRLVRYWDLASTEAKPGKDPDWTCGALVGEQDGVYYIVDVRRIRAAPGDVETLIRQTAEVDGRDVSVYMEQEPGSSGVNTIHHYSRRVLRGYSFRGIKTTGSKISRANPVSAAASNGNIKLVRGSWIPEFLDEFEAFPYSAHDDQVDAVSGAVEVLSKKPDFLFARF